MAHGKSYRVIQAEKRNAEKAAQKAREARKREFMQKNGRRILWGCLLVLVLAALVVFGIQYFYAPDGSIPVFFGNLRGAEDTWVVSNLGTDKEPRYYKLAEVKTPEGYRVDSEYNASRDPLTRGRHFIPEDPDSPAGSLHVTGVAGRNAGDMLDIYLGYSMYDGEPEKKEADIGGLHVRYAYIWSRGFADDGSKDENNGFSMLTMYTDTIRDSSVLIAVQSPTVPIGEVPDEETLMREAEKLLRCITLP